MRQTVVGGIWVLPNDFVGFCQKNSSDVFGRPDPFLLHKQPSSLNILCHVQICIAVGDRFENSLTRAYRTVLFVCDRVCSNTLNAISLSMKCISLSVKI